MKLKKIDLDSSQEAKTLLQIPQVAVVYLESNVEGLLPYLAAPLLPASPFYGDYVNHDGDGKSLHLKHPKIYSTEKEWNFSPSVKLSSHNTCNTRFHERAREIFNFVPQSELDIEIFPGKDITQLGSGNDPIRNVLGYLVNNNLGFYSDLLGNEDKDHMFLAGYDAGKQRILVNPIFRGLEDYLLRQ